MIVCKDCGRELQAEMFYRKTNGILSNGRSCKDCVRGRIYSRRNQNKEEVKRKARDKYKNDPDFRIEVLKYQAAYREKHREEKRKYAQEYREKNRELVNKRASDYRKTPKGRHNQNKKHYWNRWLPKTDSAMTDSLTLPQWLSVLERYGRKCARCKTDVDITIDHIVPVSKGGHTTKENVQPLCRRCNSWKRDQTIKYEPIADTLDVVIPDPNQVECL